MDTFNLLHVTVIDVPWVDSNFFASKYPGNSITLIDSLFKLRVRSCWYRIGFVFMFAELYKTRIIFPLIIQGISPLLIAWGGPE